MAQQFLPDDRKSSDYERDKRIHPDVSLVDVRFFIGTNVGFAYITHHRWETFLKFGGYDG